jgi:HAD superfamily hydrolase (TIGR01549 family)
VPVDAIVFDMDGTLLDSSATVPAAYAATIFELSGRHFTEEEVIAQYSAGPASALIARFIGRDATAADVDCWHRHLEDRLGQTVLYSGIPEAIRDLASRGVSLGVFTGATRRAAEMQLKHSSMGDAFHVIVGSDEIRSVKPAPDGLLRACDLLDVSADRTAYVGDAHNDLKCARAAGAVAVAAAWGHLFEPGLDADVVLPNPASLGTLLHAGSG